MKKSLVISITGIIFLCSIGYYNCRISNEINSFQSCIDRKEMHPLDSLRYKFL